ncbi:uncharacterized protein DUF3108 [Gelidibacter algens]|uniref:Uncharacterized protein DUF3108 n=1 Tax=Gelidibacter algens TaxID=49280 RepID=A0A1A7R0A5_9FLAO|nr:DUF3108 domain-containing protein [Gelidibacter algens]OBX24958.1 hypothetical protein A9996_12745 [Gelidibacter algens]RAJ24796.1 uncharacterized protein DUF3108 [Gelidibacter algens]
MKQLFGIALLLFSSMQFAQNTTIAVGEKLTFTASYNMSGLMTDIAQVTMETGQVKTSKATLLHLKCTAATFTKWDNFFKIRDLYESYVSPTSLAPYLYKRDINEGSYYKFMQYTFSHKTNSVKSLMRKKNGKGVIYDVNSNVQINVGTKDIVSTIYHIRNLDIHKAMPGDVQNFKVIFDNKELIIGVKYVGKETIQTAIGKRECYKLALSLKNNAVLKGSSNDNLLYLTADANKVPVYAKFKIPVGNGELKIKSATGLKN